MKKILLTALILLCLLAAACAGTKNTPKATEAPTQTEAPAPAVTAAPAQTETALPKAGDLLYKSMGSAEMENILTAAPTEIRIRIDQGGAAKVAAVTDAETVRELVDAFTKITILDDLAPDVTDHYNSVTFVFPGGKSVFLSLNLKSYECTLGGKRTLYTLSDPDGFWALINRLATEDA